MTKQKGTPKAPQQYGPATDAGGVYVSGKLVITVIVAVALLGAGFSWWSRYTATRRTAQFWGSQNVLLIRDAKNVQLISVGPMGPDHVHNAGDTFADHYHIIDGLVRVIDRRDVSQSPGLINLRDGLLLDRSYEAHSGVLASANDWQYGLEFRDSLTSPPLVILFSADCRRLLRHPPTIGPGVATLAPNFAEGLKKVFTEWQAAKR